MQNLTLETVRAAITFIDSHPKIATALDYPAEAIEALRAFYAAELKERSDVSWS